VNAANYANGLAQASALLTNPQFQSQYSQLPPELQERLQKNREQLVALLEKQQQNNNNNQQS
jgi:aspartate/tyrosine/aromatic aminotransferase